jgi:hypothetical protein
LRDSFNSHPKKQHISSLLNNLFTFFLLLNPFFRVDVQLKQQVKTDTRRTPRGLTLAATMWYAIEDAEDFHGRVVKGIARF